MRKQSNSTDDFDNGRPLLEFVSLPKYPVQLGTVLHTFLENQTPSYRRMPSIVLMDPWPNESTDYSKNNICQNLKSNLRNSKSITIHKRRSPMFKAKLVKHKTKSLTNYAEIYRMELETKENLSKNETIDETEESIPEVVKHCDCDEKFIPKTHSKNDKRSQIFKAKLVKHKTKSPLTYTEIYRSKRETKENLPTNKTIDEAEESIPEVVKPCNCDEMSIPKKHSEQNDKPSLIPVWIGHKKEEDTSVAKAKAASDVDANEKFGSVTNNRTSQIRNASSTCKVSRIPKLMLSIIPEECFASAKSSDENFQGSKIKKMNSDKCSVTPTPVTTLSLVENHKESRAEEISSKSPSKTVISSSSVENLQKWSTENLSSDKSSDSLLEIKVAENPKTLMDISLVLKDKSEEKTKKNSNESSGPQKNMRAAQFPRQWKSGNNSNQSFAATLLDVALAVGDGNNENVHENNIVPRPRPSIRSLEDNLHEFIISDSVSFEEAAKVVLECYPNLFNNGYVTLKGHGGSKLEYYATHESNDSLNESAVPDQTKYITSADQEATSSLLLFCKNEEEMKTDCETSDDSTSKVDIVNTKSVILSSTRTTFGGAASAVSEPSTFSEEESVGIHQKFEDDEMKADSMNSDDNVKKEIIDNINSAAIFSSSSQTTASRTSSKVSVKNTDINKSAAKISSSCPTISSGNLEGFTPDVVAIQEAMRMISINDIDETNVNNSDNMEVDSKNSDLWISKQKKMRNAIKNTLVCDSDDEDDDPTNYLRILVAAREGLLKEIQRSLRNGYMALQERYAHLYKLNAGRDVKMGLSDDSDDWMSLLKSSLKFAYWMNDFCDKSRNEIRVFEKMNVFKGKTKLSRCYYNVTLVLAGEEVPGIFIPVPVPSTTTNSQSFQ